MNRIERLPKVLNRTGLCKSSIYAFVADGTFPKPINLGVRSVGWIESDISNWIDQRIADSQKTRRED